MEEFYKFNITYNILISYEDAWLDTLYKIAGVRCAFSRYCYDATFAASWDNYESTPTIYASLAFFKNFFGKETCNKYTMRSHVDESLKLIKALLAHEGSHIKYTPFAEFFDIINVISNSVVRDFLKNGFNIIEDSIIEDRVMFQIKDTEEPILYLRKKLFDDHLELPAKIKDQIDNDPTSPETFLNYLLLKRRSHHILPAYDMYDKHQSFIDDGLKLLDYTLDKELRAKRAIAFLYEILKMLSGKEPDLNNVENPADIKPGKGIDGSGKEIPGSFDSSKVIRDDSEKASDEKHERTFRHKGRTNSDPIPEDIEWNVPETSEMVKDCMSNPSLNNAYCYPHQFVDIKGKVSLRKYEETYKETLQYLHKHSIISKIINSFRTMESKCLVRLRHYQTSGKLDMQTVHQPYNCKPFYSKSNPYVKEDTVIANVLDGSGSMCARDKQYLAGTSIIACAEAANLMNLPFAIYSFTEQGSVCYTLTFKEYNTPYNEVKNMLALYKDGDRISGIPYWNGNIDEVNIGAIVSKLLERPEKNKILIVYSDGETCGNEDTLRKLIKGYESQGVYTFGVGVRDEAVAKIYEHHIILETREDLMKVLEEINKFITSVVIKGGDK